MVNKGKAFESEIAQSLKAFSLTHSNFWYHRISDALSFMRVNPKIIMPRVFADYVALYQGIFYALECKSSHGKTSYQRDYIQDHQIQSLIDIGNAGGRGLFLINNRSVRNNFKCYVVPGYEIGKLFGDKKSAKWSKLDAYWQDLKHLKGGLWDIGKLFVR